MIRFRNVQRKILYGFSIFPIVVGAQTLEPVANPYGTLGMSQIISAEPMGEGRLNLQVRGNFYQQEKAFSGAPAKGAQITTATGGAAFGLNPYMDVFVSLGAYNIRNTPVTSVSPYINNGSGPGTTVAGLQGSIPLSQTFPARLGLQVAALFGTGKKALDTNRADGYAYLETRHYTDILARLSQSLPLVDNEGAGFRMHFNEGVVSSFEPGQDILVIGGIGVEYIPIPALVLGLEANGRTLMGKPLNTDPLWITPSLVYRTPAHLNIQIGADLSVDKNRGNAIPPNRALEPWRAFGSFTLSFDLLENKRNREAEKLRQDSLERMALANKVQDAKKTLDSISHATALYLARQKEMSDSIAAKALQDSMAQAQSLALSQRQLYEERSKRSDAEKQLLSTGLLSLDAVYFETGKTEISINSKPYLNVIARMLVKYPKLQIEVSGHTDNVGTATSNMRLSQGRAETVARYMEEVAPELMGRLSARGYGSTQPKADNHTAEGKKLNRRTELQVLNKGVLKEYEP